MHKRYANVLFNQSTENTDALKKIFQNAKFM